MRAVIFKIFEALLIAKAGEGVVTPWINHVRQAGSDPVLEAIHKGLLDETVLLAALAQALGLHWTLSPPPPPPEADMQTLAQAGAYLLPHGPIVVTLEALMREPWSSAVAPRYLLTPCMHFRNVLLATYGDQIAKYAAFCVPADLSARTRQNGVIRHLTRSGVIFSAVLGIGILADPLAFMIAAPITLMPLFMVASLVVLAGALESIGPISQPPNMPEAHLPRYSLLVPLAREARVVSALLRHLEALRYPRDRLEAFLLIEADDTETLDALAQETLPGFVSVVIVPPGEPRTKPRALNAGLLFCRGEYVVVYDAEDAPEPDQLLRACAQFKAQDVQVACLQARLSIANPRDNLITLRFALDYTTLFDAIKCGFAKAGWPVPLGGSSNHFRTQILRDLGGWDAWNVTEDADLGVRLARFGYRVADLPSTTWEEAPNTYATWMPQRIRWMKGWLQTLFTHGRNPVQLLRDLGPFDFMVLASLGLGIVLGSLLFPLFMILLAVRAVYGVGDGGLFAFADRMILCSFVLIFLVELVPAFLALRRRRALVLLVLLPTAPILYAMISLATWLGLIEWLRNPYHWRKTEHGLARSTGGIFKKL